VAATGTHPTPTMHPRAREAREHARKSAAEHLQQASTEIDKTCQKATAGVRRSLDTALERMRDVSGELRQGGEHQTAERQDAPERTSDKTRRQMGRPPSGCVESRIHSAAGGPVAALPESVRRVGRVEARWPRSTSWS
jgi:hypothetical protein